MTAYKTPEDGGTRLLAHSSLLSSKTMTITNANGRRREEGRRRAETDTKGRPRAERRGEKRRNKKRQMEMEREGEGAEERKSRCQRPSDNLTVVVHHDQLGRNKSQKVMT